MQFDQVNVYGPCAEDVSSSKFFTKSKTLILHLPTISPPFTAWRLILNS